MHFAKSSKYRSKHFIIRLLLDNGMVEAKLVTSCMNKVIDMDAEVEPLNEADTARYHNIVGILLYLATKTRPNIRLIAGKINSYVASLRIAYMIEVKRTMCH